MKIKTQALAFVLAFTVLGAAQAQECTRPSKPAVPDGAAAERQEMIDAQQAVQKYVKSMESYLACIDKQEKAAMKKAQAEEKKLSAERRKAFAKRYNAGVEAVKMIAQEFNKQLKAYQKSQSD